MDAPDDLYRIGPRAGYAPAVGVLAAMLTNARHTLRKAVRDLPPAALHAAPAGARNSIGAILAHLAAAERMFQVMTFEDRRFDEAEEASWGPAFRYDAGAADGTGLDELRTRLEEVREATLAGLRERDDAWLAAPRPFFGHAANNHYYWFHYLQDEVRHTGQIILIRKYLLEESDPEFMPYG